MSVTDLRVRRLEKNFISKEHIDYYAGQAPTVPNVFVKSIADNLRHSDKTGYQASATGFSISDLIKVKNGDTVYLNTNQTVVFYTDDVNRVAYFVPSVSTTTELRWRKIKIDQDVTNMSFTMVTAWKPEIGCYLNPDQEFIPAGINSNSIVHDSNTLTEILFDKGLSHGTKQQIELTARAGVIEQDGAVVYTVKNQGLILETGGLEKNSYYLIDLGSVITGRIFASLGNGSGNVLYGNPLAMGGRKTMWFKTDDVEGRRLFIFARAVGFVIGTETVTFDISQKCKVYKVDEPTITTQMSKMPSVSSDISGFPSATIAEPKWAMWNINGNMYKLTLTTDYGTEPIVVEYLDSNGVTFRKHATIGGQGRTSMTFESHNIKCKLTNNDGSKFVLKIGDWLPRSTFHFKVNYTDFTQSKNQAGADFVVDWHRDLKDATKKTNPWEFGYVYNPAEIRLSSYDKRPRGVIGGVPCLICTHWNPRAVGTMNLNRFAENYALDSKNPLHRGFKGDLDYASKDRWEELCSDTEGVAMTDETWMPFYDFSKWMRDNSSTTTVETFKAGHGVKYDKENLIDYWLLGELIYAADNGWANQLWLSYNKVKYYMVWDDMDSTLGVNYLGEVIHPPNKEFLFHNTDLYLWKQLVRAYPTEIKDRYHALRNSGRFSVDKFREIYGSFIARFPYEWHEMDFHMWRDRKSIKAGSFGSLERIVWFISERLKYLDTKYGYSK